MVQSRKEWDGVGTVVGIFDNVVRLCGRKCVNTQDGFVFIILSVVAGSEVMER